MLSNTFFKTIYTKRWMLLSWFVGLAALVILTILFYPALKDSFGQSLKSVPDSLKAFIGDSKNYTTIAGYTDLQVFFQFSYIVLIFGVILFTGVLAGEETDGTLQTLLAQPISRGRIYLEKMFGSMALLIAACMSLFVGSLVGVLLVHERLGIQRLFLSTVSEWLIVLVFSSLAYALGAATGKRAIAGGIAGVLAFMSLLITSLAVTINSLHLVDKFSPFHYFDKPGILLYGPRWGDMLILFIISIVFFIVGYFLFIRRDIYQR
jgi:ABC-2 type transport system permease protein